MMAEGILPSNEGRGYVLRRIIRRALLNVNKLKSNSIILFKLVDDVISNYVGYYYDLEKATLFIKKNLKIEEEKFSETLSTGLALLKKEISNVKGKQFDPKLAFKLYDTYGFPIDMTQSILLENKINLNIEAYKEIVESNKMSQKGSWINNEKKGEKDLYLKINEDLFETQFCGYELDFCESKLIGIIQNGSYVNSIENADNSILIFEKTPFYAEAGGQVGDTGEIFDNDNKLVGEISDTKKIGNGIYLHFLVNCFSEIKNNEKYFLKINKTRRRKITNNHSATHLLHESLRQVV